MSAPPTSTPERADSLPGSEPSAVATASSPRRRAGAARRILTRPETGGGASAVIVFVFFAAMAGDNGFLGKVGTANWLNSAAELGIVAVPIGMLMIAGEFDLTVGAMVGTGSICVGMLGVRQDTPTTGDRREDRTEEREGCGSG